MTTFPKDFWWGTGASSPQAEGAAPGTDWLEWEKLGKVPVSGDGNGFGRRYREDFELYRRYGLVHHRLGIEWARIEPEEGRRDAAAVEHYRQILVAAAESGIKPWVCLHHFVLPTWVGAHGFALPEAREQWRRHVEFVAEAFGDLVYGWKPINEPIAYASIGFVAGINPPGARDRALGMAALEGIHLAKYDAAKILRQGGKPVATIHAVIPLFPEDASAAAAADAHDQAIWRCWMGAMTDGVFQVPGREPVEVPDFRDVFDLVGFSYYFGASVKADGSFGLYPPGAEAGLKGYVPWSEGLGYSLDRLHAELPGLPLLVSEHGVGATDDAFRCRVLKASLQEVEDRLRRGYDIRGFFHWTGVDNYEWSRGFTIPFGVFDRDRRPKGSADLLRSYALAGEANVEVGGRA